MLAHVTQRSLTSLEGTEVALNRVVLDELSLEGTHREGTTVLEPGNEFVRVEEHVAALDEVLFVEACHVDLPAVVCLTYLNIRTDLTRGNYFLIYLAVH